MRVAVILPWCSIDEPYTLNGLHLIPFRHDGADDLNAVAKLYVGLNGKPVSAPAVLSSDGTNPVWETSELKWESDWKRINEHLALACFAALADRDIFAMRDHYYCNTHHFAVYGHPLNEDGQPQSFISLTSSRIHGAGQFRSGWGTEDLTFQSPIHVSGVNTVRISMDVFEGLIRLRDSVSDVDWLRFSDAIACFNLANTDSEDVPLSMEWVLLSGAFQRWLGVRHDQGGKEVARAFTDAWQPRVDRLTSAAARTLPGKRAIGDVPFRQEWSHEFYSIRNEYAHGGQYDSKTRGWSTNEHLTIAKLSFPLLVKQHLARAGLYTLNTKDRIWIDVFEEILDHPGDPEKVADVFTDELARDMWPSDEDLAKALRGIS